MLDVIRMKIILDIVEKKSNFFHYQVIFGSIATHRSPIDNYYQLKHYIYLKTQNMKCQQIEHMVHSQC